MLKNQRSRTWIVRGMTVAMGVTTVLALILGATMVTGVLAPLTARAAPEVYLKYEGIGSQTTTPSTFGCIDCTMTPLAALGTVACSNCAEGDPASGAFTLGLGFTPYPPSPCKPLRVSGELTVTWDNGLSSTAPVDGRFIDNTPTLILSGKFGSDPVFAGDPLRVVLNHFPPSPCLASTNQITGELAISTR